jgi:hypothetical protein
MHAEAGKLAVVSMLSRRAPVMIGEVDVYDIPGAGKREVRSGLRGETCEPERERESRGTARLTATFTSTGGDLLE